MFQRGYSSIEKDLSTFEIMKTIQKLKSVMSFIVKKDLYTISKMKELLVEQTTICISSCDDVDR